MSKNVAEEVQGREDEVGMNQSEGSHGGSVCQRECTGREENIRRHPYKLEQKLNIVLKYWFQQS